ncbi:hypothetical protein G9A89_013153 [Geosiphon pyriformis]|nr:hypothetical protein G9A89_013153 [Geosiphon pyriformis]
MGDYSYLPQQSEEYFEEHIKNDLDFIELNPLFSCLICFPIEDQSSKQFQNFWNWFLKEHSAETYTLNDFKRAVTANQYDEEYKFQIIEENISFTTWFETKFRIPILISKWCMELERRTQGPGVVMTEYFKAIRKLIKCVDFGRNWTEEQKIHSFTKGLRTNLLYALWSFLALKDNPTINMAIELAQIIKDNQRMHLGSTLPVFAPPKQSETTNNPKDLDLNPVLISPNNHHIKDNKIAVHLYCNNPSLPPLASRNNNTQNNRPNNNNSTNQPEKNPFYAFNLTDNNHNIDELAINTSEPTRKKKKVKVDFVIDPKKAFTSTADNNKLPKTKVFKNLPKLEPPKIVQKSESYSVVKNLMETPAHITFDQLIIYPQFRKDLHKSLIPKKKTPKTNKCSRQAGLADNSNVTSLICKAQVAGYFIDLILNSGSSVSVIAKYFLEAIGRKIDKPFTRPITNVHGDKKKSLGIAKAVPV